MKELKIHITYLCIIFMIVGLGAVVLAGYSNEAFVAQFSFASTITSIVLSVVAIWMSISGERSTNDIKNRMETIVRSLEATTNNARNVNENYEVQFDELKKLLHSIPKEVNKEISAEIFSQDSRGGMKKSSESESIEIIKRVLTIYNEQVINTAIFLIDKSDYSKSFVKKNVFVKMSKEYSNYYKDKMSETLFGVSIGILGLIEVLDIKQMKSKEEVIQLLQEQI